MGKAPAQIDLQPLDLNTLTLPQALPLTLPSMLASQRPDIRAAQAALHQASAHIGVASAHLYPRLTLSGSAGAERTGIATLANSINVWSIGMTLMQPLFDGGQLRSKKRSAVAAYDAAMATWQQTVLQALQQVADVLRALENDALALQARTQAAQDAANSLEITQRQYQAGGVSYLNFLDAQRQRKQTELDRIAAQARRYADTAALFQALGGGGMGEI